MASTVLFLKYDEAPPDPDLLSDSILSLGFGLLAGLAATHSMYSGERGFGMDPSWPRLRAAGRGPLKIWRKIFLF